MPCTSGHSHINLPSELLASASLNGLTLRELKHVLYGNDTLTFYERYYICLVCKGAIHHDYVWASNRKNGIAGGMGGQDTSLYEYVNEVIGMLDLGQQTSSGVVGV